MWGLRYKTNKIKKPILSCLLVLVVVSCAGSKKSTETKSQKKIALDEKKPEIATVKPVTGDLLGIISKKDLEHKPFKDWFTKQYGEYALDENALSQLKNRIGDIQVQVFMGTWCSDSRRGVPRFYKIMDYLNYPENKVTLIALDRSKKSPENLLQGYRITKVPTYIFYKNGKELGRIVEAPTVSLEKDMLEIINRQE